MRSTASASEPFELAASAAQIARVLGEDSPRAAKGEWLSDEEVRARLSGHTPRKSHDDALGLIRDAFRLSVERHGAEGNAMPLSVMKNRLLLATDGAFHESDYGAPNMLYLVASFPEEFRLERRSGQNVAIRLISEDVESATPPRAAPSPALPGGRVRPDLWRATIDYRSGKSYWWSPETKTVVASSTGEAEYRWPTQSAEDIDEWRKTFRDAFAPEGNPNRAYVDQWVEERSGTGKLPAELRRSWNVAQRERVESVIVAFFNSISTPVPSDLIVDSAVVAHAEGETERLRQLLHDCIDAMTAAELSGVQLPALIVARVINGPGR